MTALDDRLTRQRSLLADITAQVANSSTTTPTMSSAAPGWLRTVGQEQQAQAEEPRGLWEQLTDPVKHFVPGVVGFLKDAVETAVAVPRIGFDLIKDQDLKRDENYSGLQSYLAHYAPAVNTLGQSFHDTGYALTHPGEYVKAVQEGRIVDAILRDVGNVALIGLPVAKAIGSAASVSTGLSEGAARALEATKGATITPALPEVGAAVGESAMAGSTLLGRAPNLASLVDEAALANPYTAQIPARGLAGMAARGGNLELAETLGRVGRGVRTITSLGEQVGNAPAKPFALAGRGIARLLRSVPRGLETVGETGVPAGMVRLYRGDPLAPLMSIEEARAARAGQGLDWINQSPEMLARDEVRGRWFTPDRDVASTYPTNRDPWEGNRLSYIDLTMDEYGRIRDLGDQPAEIRDLSRAPNEVVIPQDLMGRVQAVPETITNRERGIFPRLSALLAGEWVRPEYEPQVVNPYEGSRLYRGLQKGNQLWKTAILPTSPKWLIGNAVGNALQAAIHSGVGPIALVRRMREIAKSEGGWRNLWDNSGFSSWTPEQIASHGLTHAEWLEMRDYMANAPAGRISGSTVGRAFNRAAGFSWKLNEFVDNMTRQAVYLEKLGQGVPSEAAVQTVLRSLGDFRNFSPVERNIVRQILPFYTWLKHQTVATLRLPLQSPTRAAMLATLGDIYSDPKMADELTAFIGSRIPIGGNLFADFGGLNPLADISESPFGPFDPRSIGSAVTPLVKFPAAGIFGVDLNRLDTLGRPSSTRSVGVFGEEATPPITRLFSNPAQALGELGYIATQMGPASIRSLRDLALGPEQRYRTGYTYGDENDPNKTWPRLLLRGLNLPGITTIDTDEMQREMEQTRRRLAG